MDQVVEIDAVALPPWVARRRLDVNEYRRMGEAGILHEDDRVELIEGVLVEMAAVGGPHIGVVIRLNRLLPPLVAGRAEVSVQNPVRLGDHSEPEPDIALLRPRADDYGSGLPPLAEDVLLLIEVSDSTLRYDRTVKQPLYARHSIPEVWVVDLQGGVVEVCRGPSKEGYGSVTREGRGAVLEPAGLPGVRVGVDEVLG